MTMLRWLAVLFLVAGVAATTSLRPALGDEKDKGEAPLTKEQEAQAATLRTVVAANRVAVFGRKHKSPEALVTAGSMLLEADAATPRGKPTLKITDDSGKEVESADKGLKEQAEELFDEARAMKTRTKEVAALIKAAKSGDYTLSRAVAGGPKRISRKVDAGGQQRFHIPYIAGQPATLALTSDTPVRLVLKQGESTLSNNVVTSFSYTWRPSKAKVFVEIHGMGKVAHFTVYAN